MTKLDEFVTIKEAAEFLGVSPNTLRVGRMESLRNKALAELADDPVARQRFLYWTWTFDAFLKEAEAIHRKKTP